MDPNIQMNNKHGSYVRLYSILWCSHVPYLFMFFRIYQPRNIWLFKSFLSENENKRKNSKAQRWWFWLPLPRRREVIGIRCRASVTRTSSHQQPCICKLLYLFNFLPRNLSISERWTFAAPLHIATGSKKANWIYVACFEDPWL